MVAQRERISDYPVRWHGRLIKAVIRLAASNESVDANQEDHLFRVPSETARVSAYRPDPLHGRGNGIAKWRTGVPVALFDAHSVTRT